MKRTCKRSVVIGWFLAFVCMLLLVPQGRAQSTTDGAIGGTVMDQSQAVIPSAHVTVHNLGTDSSSTASTDDNGRYLVAHLQPGIYEVEISAPDFGTFKATRVTVEWGAPPLLTLRLT